MLDYLFYIHDVDTELAQTAQQQNAADLALLTQVVALEPEAFDKSGEASFYAGFTVLAMIHELASRGGITLALAPLLLSALEEAFTDIQYGLEHIKPKEVRTLLAEFFEHDDNGTRKKSDDTYYLDFSIPTDGSFVQEGIEAIALNVVNAALDGGEANNPALDTSGAVSLYHLAFDLKTRDLDINSGHYSII